MISLLHLLWIVPATAFVFVMIGGLLQGGGKPITGHDDIAGLSPEDREARRAEEQREEILSGIENRDDLAVDLLERFEQLRRELAYARADRKADHRVLERADARNAKLAAELADLKRALDTPEQRGPSDPAQGPKELMIDTNSLVELADAFCCIADDMGIDLLTVHYQEVIDGVAELRRLKQSLDVAGKDMLGVFAQDGVGICEPQEGFLKAGMHWLTRAIRELAAKCKAQFTTIERQQNKLTEARRQRDNAVGELMDLKQSLDVTEEQEEDGMAEQGTGNQGTATASTTKGTEDTKDGNN